MDCEICRFDSDGYTWGDLMGSLRALSWRWAQTIEGADPAALTRRPEPDTWSVLEYASHTAKVLALAGELTARALNENEPDLTPPVELGADASVNDDGDAAPILRKLSRQALSLHQQVALLSEAERERRFTFFASPMTVRGGVEFVVHEANHHVSDAGRVLARLGAGSPHQSGTVVGLFASDGGVPKLAIDEAVISYRGVAGDRQASRQHHGRVWQALCLWSSEVIDELVSQGHPMAPGLGGENITVRGIEWASIRAGTRLRFGDGPDAVLVEISVWADPCYQVRGCFDGGDEHLIDHSDHPFMSRAYASVLRDGVIRVGDVVIIEP